jgi:predicted RNA-binding Zn-ribbon protein involved in translation (DUF1610 family)
MTDKPNYIATVTLRCTQCRELEAVPYDMGAPLSELQLPAEVSVPFICPNCGPRGDVRVVLNRPA